MLEGHYRSGPHVLGDDFFAPCLSSATKYRRAAGYFSSRALVTWAAALPRLIGENSLKIELIASPDLSPEDLQVLRDLSSDARRREYRQMMVDRILEEVVAFTEAPGDNRARAEILAWLVANGRLDLRFAFLADDEGIFHEKIGIFDFPGGHQAAFTGSANETLGGHRRNYESIDVFRTWVAGEADRVAVKAEQFDEAWDNEAEGLDVLKPSPDVVARLKARAPSKLPRPSKPPPEQEDPRWRHQSEAMDAFLKARAGILEMATGSGKTRTCLKIIDRLIGAGEVDSLVIAMDGRDLLAQWGLALDAWSLGRSKGWLIYRHFDKHHELNDFLLDPTRGVMLISREQLPKLLPRITPERAQRMIIVHDEVHGLGVPSLVATLGGQHAKFGWRLGLSATPERAYDQAGNAFIDAEIGPTLYSFPLELAIRRGVLCAFDYEPLAYELTPDDRQRIRDVYAREAARRREGPPMSPEQVWTEIAKVYKTAEMKPQVFQTLLARDPGVLKSCIIFVETKEYGDRLLNDIHAATMRYRTYYAEDDREHLLEFARGEIDCLITCHRISQGIDIQSLETVVLFASARSKLETIQRIGRCLRSDPARPDKRARVIDFVRPASPTDTVPNADQDRCAWLTGLAQVRRGPDA